MDIANKTIWQQGAGDTDRDYSDQCLRWDVILNGPGEVGEWPNCKEVLKTDQWSSKKITDIARFAEEMKPGDLVVLRLGTAIVRGVGEIVGTYEWHEEFGDIDGWDIQHVRRVRWLWKSEPNVPKTFETYALKWGDTTQRLGPGPVADWLASLDVPVDVMKRPLVDLPAATGHAIDIAAVSAFLFNHGVASSSINNLVGEISELTRIAKWYQTAGMPSEHETVAYLVVPLLRTLGWTPQRMAVEWNRVDVALFDRLPRSDTSLRAVVEAKRMNNSCLTARSQAESYAVNKPACDRLIVTDGLRYGVHTRDGDGAFHLDSYLNLARLRHDYPIYECEGAERALLAMAPEWIPDQK